MKTIVHDYNIEHAAFSNPTDEISGYLVRPGMFDVNGATVLPIGVNFTIHTHHGTNCELLLFHRGLHHFLCFYIFLQ